MVNDTEQETLRNDPVMGAVRAWEAGGRGLRFLEAFIREPFKVGSFWPSSSALSRALVGGCEFRPGDTVVELGPGTGAFTELLLERLRGRGRMLALEISPTNISVLRKRFSPCEIIQDSAEHLTRYVEPRSARCVVSGLAWGNMLPAMQDRILAAVLASIAPRGQFVAFGYIHAKWLPTSLRFQRRLRENFRRVEFTPVVWRNLPPAFVYRCWRD
jgi:phosphatidylethanolamine/phosphatidyl-N-methylethanolamine N-methyltransferase